MSDREDQGAFWGSVLPPASTLSPGTSATADMIKQLEGVADTVIVGRQEQFRALIEAVKADPSPSSYHWVDIDLYEAFDPETSIREKRNPWRNWSVYVLFLPLLLTWIGLSIAVRDYNNLPESQRVTRSFFEVWVEGSSDSFLGGALSLFNLAIAVAVVFVVAIGLGVASDKHAEDVDEQRDDLRSALTSASLALNAKYPRTPEGTAAALGSFTEDLQQASVQASQVLTQLADQAKTVNEQLSANARESAALIDRAGRDALDKHMKVVAEMDRALGFATEALAQASVAAQTLATSTELDRRRRQEQDRAISRMSDLLADLQLTTANMMPPEDYEPAP